MVVTSAILVCFAHNLGSSAEPEEQLIFYATYQRPGFAQIDRFPLGNPRLPVFRTCLSELPRKPRTASGAAISEEGTHRGSGSNLRVSMGFDPPDMEV